MTQAEVDAYNSRRMPKEQKAESGCDKESELHGEIIAECKRRGWIAFHGSMAHQTFRTLGEPDFVILADNGRVFMVECKTRTGKLSTDQLAIKAWAERLGHQIHVVRSLADFIEIIEIEYGRMKTK